METAINIVGNPITVILERGAYLFIGIFLLVALFTGVRRNIKENEKEER
tara:strand:+ start:723 stop:869 length:147 start_codon:yes stop_codon:yes gene_type:complete